MNIFSNKYGLYFLGLIALATTSHAMQQQPTQAPIVTATKAQQKKQVKHKEDKTSPKIDASKKAAKAEQKKSVPKEQPKKEKKQKKQEKGKSKQVSVDSHKEDENEKCKKAFTLVTNLTSRYLDATDAAKNTTDMCMESDKWKTAQAVYKGAYNLLNKSLESHPELKAILLYLQGHLQEAKKLITDFKESTDSTTNIITNWYKALILSASPSENPESRNRLILEIVDKVLSEPLNNYKTVRESLIANDELAKLVEDQSGNTDTGKIRLLRMKLLLGTNAREKSAEEALISAHEQGLIDASVCLIQMYCDGIFVEQSLENALKILQRAMQFEKAPTDLMVNNLKKITELAAEKHEWVHYIHSLYVDIIEKIKHPGTDEQIMTILDLAETKLTSMNKSQATIAAKLIAESGVFEALLPIAETNRKIAKRLSNIAINRVTKFKHKEADYAKIATIEQNFRKRNEECIKAAERIMNLLPQYINQDAAKKLQAQLQENSNNWINLQDMYQDAFDMLQKCVRGLNLK